MNPRRLGILLGLLAVVGVGVYFYQSSNEKKEQEGKSALYKVQKIYDEEHTALPEAEKAQGVMVDVDAKYPKTVAELNGLLASKTINKRALFEASMKLGSMYLENGNPTKAVSALQPMPEFAKSSFQKASAYFLLGTAQERSGQAKEAYDTFQLGLSKEVEGLKGEFLLGIIRTLVKTNEAEKAKTFLEKLRKDLPGSKTLELAEGILGAKSS